MNKTLRLSVPVLFSILALGAFAPLTFAATSEVSDLATLQTALASTTVDTITR